MSEAQRALPRLAPPPDLFDDSVKLADLRRTYEAPALLFGALLPFVLGGLPLLLWLLFPAFVPFGGGQARQGLGSPTSPLVWGLAFAQLPALWATRTVLRAGDRAGFWLRFNAQSVLQAFWIQALTFYCMPFFPWLGNLLLLGIFLAGAFNDAWLFYDSPKLRVQYFAVLASFDALLLLVDLVGGRGLLALWRGAPVLLLEFVCIQVVVLLLTQAIISLAGRNAREHDTQVAGQSKLQREMELLLQERQVVQRLCGLLTQGLAAGRFSHDVANPITMIDSSVHEIEALLEATAAGGVLEASRAVLLRQMVDELKEANRRVLEMTRILARSVRDAAAPRPRKIAEVFEEAERSLRLALRSHAAEEQPPDVALEPADVLVAEGHAAALGNILTNGALQCPQRPLVVRGRRIDPCFYALVVRDFGVSPEERPAALERVRRALALGTEQGAAQTLEPPAKAYRGYGIGLMMAKVLFVRHDGWIDVRAPAEGPGLVLCAVLPTGPLGAQQPEAALERLPALPGIF